MGSLTRTIRRGIKKRGTPTRGAWNFLRIQKARDDAAYKKQKMDREDIVK